ncbi:MAG: DUF1223 domain-containing protein [Gammaproteobacteria bacterium]
MPFARWMVLFAGAAILRPVIVSAAPQSIASGVTQVSLLELYTSEGCSSCPPAEEWLSGFTHDPRLWKQVVPIALHVDYWDNLGWRDPFDSHIYTLRQQRYAERWGNGEVYTPEFVLNGKDWSSWFGQHSLRLLHASDVGRLKVTMNNPQITATFTPVNSSYESLVLNVTVLAFDVKTRVGAGENAGRELKHDFLVIGYEQQPFTMSGATFTTRLPIPHEISVKASRYALAAWVSAPNNPAPIQSVGGWLATAPETLRMGAIVGPGK